MIPSKIKNMPEIVSNWCAFSVGFSGKLLTIKLFTEFLSRSIFKKPMYPKEVLEERYRKRDYLRKCSKIKV
ncbi:MAG: hypothetical protein L6N96_06760 [Candidatus Methylarchaceae archaeon HK02M2]|nr:hypothetical protein [Candidatus Methylarchaceae archaeon HK02M2]